MLLPFKYNKTPKSQILQLMKIVLKTMSSRSAVYWAYLSIYLSIYLCLFKFISLIHMHVDMSSFLKAFSTLESFIL